MSNYDRLMRDAQDWFARTERSPERTETESGIWWRWTLPDVGEPPDRGDLLPREVFDQLRSFDSKFNWLFRTYKRAREAAIMATFHAMREGWRPSTPGRV